MSPIRLLTPSEAGARRDALIDLLVDAVESGASVNFVWPMTREKSAAWWEGALASHARGERLIFAGSPFNSGIAAIWQAHATAEDPPERFAPATTAS